jgi:alkylation response protein AidB-like acyl-CoA dehydrogenase
MAGADQAFEAFRREVRVFIDAHLPEALARRGLTGLHSSKADQQLWGQILHARGWGAPGWPLEYGGAGWSPAQIQIFDEECYLAGAPELSWNGVRLVGPVIYTFGSDQQKARFLPPTLRWEIFWGQGFSEPESGSDLASLKTAALAEGDHYVVNGSKIWMTDGHFADWLFCLVRTDSKGRKQEGISFLLIDAHSAGVEMRPIRTIDHQHTLNQVFFTNVRVPLENRVGPEGAGWGYAKFLLANERTSAAEVPRCKFYRQRLWQLADSCSKNGRPLAEDPVFMLRLAQLEVDLLALEALVLETLSSPTPSVAHASVLKLKGSQLQQALGELMVDAIGADAVVHFEPQNVDNPATGIVSDYLYRRATTIYGGSAEIQRTIIASHLLPAA